MKIIIISIFSVLLLCKPSQNGNSQNKIHDKPSMDTETVVNTEKENERLKEKIADNQEDIGELIKRLTKPQIKVAPAAKNKFVFIYKKPRPSRVSNIPIVVDTVKYEVGCPDSLRLVLPVIPLVKRTFFQRLFSRKKT